MQTAAEKTAAVYSGHFRTSKTGTHFCARSFYFTITTGEFLLVNFFQNLFYQERLDVPAEPCIRAKHLPIYKAAPHKAIIADAGLQPMSEPGLTSRIHLIIKITGILSHRVFSAIFASRIRLFILPLRRIRYTGRKKT